MTRLSTGYTFLNIQDHSRYLREILIILIKLEDMKLKKNINF